MSLPKKCVECIDAVIAEQGFISVSKYMQICLQHPEDGYYVSGTPLGKDGDFITASEISQLFGEMIGVFLLFHADKIFPNGYNLCELGAGWGTLCHDIMRVVSGKIPPKDIFFLESNHHLKQEQKKNIPDCKHISDLKDLPHSPIFFLANEFFDALPIDVFKLAGAEKYPLYLKNASRQGYYEWVMGEPIKNDTAYISGVQEICPDAHDYIHTLCQHIKTYGGMGLICDYGYDVGSLQKTSFRGFKNHQVTDGLQNAGDCDLTANVDFRALAQTVQRAGCHSYPLMTQKHFLEALQIDTRLHRLLRSVTGAERDSMIKGVQKLLNPAEMGEVFKFFCITDKDYGLYPFVE